MLSSFIAAQTLFYRSKAFSPFHSGRISMDSHFVFVRPHHHGIADTYRGGRLQTPLSHSFT